MNGSQELFAQAQQHIPGGVNSPVRAFRAVGGNPLFIHKAHGCWMYDEDGHRYLDLIGSWGPMIVGHTHPHVVSAIQSALEHGTSFGAPTKGEVLFAQELCEAHPALEMVRLCSSGTESTMHAIRLARGYTKKDVIIKIEGCYHGAHDGMLVKAGSGLATFSSPDSAGVPTAVAQLTKVIPFHDLAALEDLLQKGDVAGVILEAVPGNMGCIVPDKEYLDGVIALCAQYEAVSIIDEVMTGFRLARGGACAYYDLKPDLVCLGKIVGGGLPLAAFGGKSEIMKHLSPVGSVYQAGTLSGNPLAVAAGRATLSLLTEDFYARLEEIAEKIEQGIRPVVEAKGYSFSRVGSMFTIFFCAQAPRSFCDVSACDMEMFARFHALALKEGLYFPPSQYEAVFLAGCMAEEDIQFLVEGVRKIVAIL